MELKELLKFIEIEDQRLNEYYSHADHEKMVLARTVKLSEEMGELCEEILAHNSLQRTQKMKGHNANLPEEFADVIIVALLLAKSLNIDIESALKSKIEKINQRYRQV